MTFYEANANLMDSREDVVREAGDLFEIKIAKPICETCRNSTLCLMNKNVGFLTIVGCNYYVKEIKRR